MLCHEITDPPPRRPPLLAAVDAQDDLLVASNDLERLQRLLSEASESLLGHFQALSDQLGQSLREPSAPAAATGPHLQQAMKHVAGAITAMQFQDLATQLIDHTTHRLRGCADRLAQQAMGDDEDGPCVVESTPQRPNPVIQDEMDAGSVELF